MEWFKKIVSYPFSILFYVSFGGVLVLFHPLQWLAVTLGGASAHRGMINVMNLCLMRCLHILGVVFDYKNDFELPKDRPLIIVSNHQSMFDVPLISWCMHRYKPKFISKMELGKGIPSISFNLRRGEHVLIERKNPRQSLPAIQNFAKRVADQNFGAVIFPEGTRSTDGKPKSFAQTGLKILFKNIPNAVIVPVTINNSWKLIRHGDFPLGMGIKITLEVKAPIELNAKPVDELIIEIEKSIVSTIK